MIYQILAPIGIARQHEHLSARSHEDGDFCPVIYRLPLIASIIQYMFLFAIR